MASRRPTDLPQPLPVPGQEPSGQPAMTPEAVLVDVVALTADLDLFNAAREAVGERNPVWRARSAEEAADLLISGRCGVLLLDVASVSASVGTLIEQIVEQFPDVVICVAGARADEPMLAPLISDGLVYRFMHKPATAKRAAMFLQAAIRRHVERREGRAESDPFAPLLRTLRQPADGWPRIYAVIALLVAIAVATPFALEHTVFAERADSDRETAPVVALNDAGARADPVLSRARAALQAGRLDAPEGRNALDLYRAVLLAQPDHAEARAGLRRTVEALLQRAEQDLQQGRTDAARDTVQRVLAVVPQQTAALALATRIDPPDTPSQQLEREQEADAAASRNAATAVVPATTTASVAALSRPPAVASGGAAASAVVEPVLPASNPAASPVRTRPPVDTTPRPDPLAPRYVNAAPAAPQARSGATARPAVRSFGAPIAPRHDTLGYVKAPVEPAASEPPPPGPTVAADEFDRIYSREPEYPRQALRDGLGGWVELEFTIAASGAVRDVQVVAAEPVGVFDAAARDALAQWRFKPRYVNGQPVAQRSSITLRFDVER